MHFSKVVERQCHGGRRPLACQALG
jgi:hypothetical protein